jgi:Mrp family chromosome partitioning ATPase
MGTLVDTQLSTQQFGQLRARMEAMFSEPAVIVITSACSRDGKTLTAVGLSRSLANAGHRVVMIDASVDAPFLPQIHRPPLLAGRIELANLSLYAKPVAGQRFKGISLADERLESGVSLDQIRTAVFDMRAHFDFVIVDTAPLLDSDLAVLFSTIADGILLTLRLGRTPTGADTQVVKTLGRLGANVLGALTVTPSVIRDFSAQRERGIPTVRYPARHTTSQHALDPETPALEYIDTPRSNVGS